MSLLFRGCHCGGSFLHAVPEERQYDRRLLVAKGLRRDLCGRPGVLRCMEGFLISIRVDPLCRCRRRSQFVVVLIRCTWSARGGVGECPEGCIA